MMSLCCRNVAVWLPPWVSVLFPRLAVCGVRKYGSRTRAWLLLQLHCQQGHAEICRHCGMGQTPHRNKIGPARLGERKGADGIQPHAAAHFRFDGARHKGESLGKALAVHGGLSALPPLPESTPTAATGEAGRNISCESRKAVPMGDIPGEVCRILLVDDHKLLMEGVRSLLAPYGHLRVVGMHLQEISNTYHQIGLARTRCQHSLINHYLPLFFPEFEKYFHSSRTEWFCRFLEKFPTPLCITSISKEDFLTQAWNLVGRKVAKERFLEEVYELAQKSVGLPIMENCPELYGFRIQLQRHLQLTAQRNDLEKLSIGILTNNPDYHRLQTIPGIGPILALIILAESGDLRRFAHHRQYLSFCGFNLSGSQSGQSKSRYRISKRGNARLRYAFWLAATVAIRQRENSFRRKYETYIAQDRNNADLKRKAYCAIAIKVARVAHSLIKNAMDYRGYHATPLFFKIFTICATKLLLPLVLCDSPSSISIFMEVRR